MAEPVVNLGARLRDVRMRSGLSLREVSRQLGVSPSFVSQLENGKSQPSVATLYSLSQLLGVSIDELFASADTGDVDGGEDAEAPDAGTTAAGAPGTPTLRAVTGTASSTTGEHATPGESVNRSDFSSPVDAFPRDAAASRVSVSHPGSRPRLVMDTGVIWERLADNTGVDLDFLEIIYPAHSSSTNDNRMLQHAGMEFGFLLEGELEVTVGFEVFTLRAGEAVGFDPAQPHLFRNLGSVPARGIWVVRHPHA